MLLTCLYPNDTTISYLDLSYCDEELISEKILAYEDLAYLDISNTDFKNLDLLSQIKLKNDFVLFAKKANIDNEDLDRLLYINRLIELDIENNDVTSLPSNSSVILHYDYNYIEGVNNKYDALELNIDQIQYRSNNISLTTLENEIVIDINKTNLVNAVHIYDIYRGNNYSIDKTITLMLQAGLNKYILSVDTNDYQVIYDIEVNKQRRSTPVYDYRPYTPIEVREKVVEVNNDIVDENVEKVVEVVDELVSDDVPDTSEIIYNSYKK